MATPRITLKGFDLAAIDAAPAPSVIHFASTTKGGIVPPGCPLMITKGVDKALTWMAKAEGKAKLSLPDGTESWQVKLGPLASMTFEEALEKAMALKPQDGRKKNGGWNRKTPKPKPESEAPAPADPEAAPKPEAPAPVVQTREVRYGVEMPKGWRTDAEIAAEIEGKTLQQFLLDAILEAIKTAKEKKAMKAVQVLLDSGLTADRISELFKRIQNKE